MPDTRSSEEKGGHHSFQVLLTAPLWSLISQHNKDKLDHAGAYCKFA